MKTMAQWVKQKTADIPDVGSIPLMEAGICWGLTEREKWSDPIEDLRVVNFKQALIEGTEERGVWKAARSTGGACMKEWKDGRNPRSTPLGNIAEMAFDGKLPKGEKFVEMLMEFSKIDGCDWALHMIAALKMGHILTDNDEELTT